MSVKTASKLHQYITHRVNIAAQYISESENFRCLLITIVNEIGHVFYQI